MSKAEKTETGRVLIYQENPESFVITPCGFCKGKKKKIAEEVDTYASDWDEISLLFLYLLRRR